MLLRQKTVNDPPDFILAPDTITVYEDFSIPQIITFTTNNAIFGEPYTLTPEPATFFTKYAIHGMCYENQSLTQTIVIFDEDAIDKAIHLTLISEHGSLTLLNKAQLSTVEHS